MKNLKKCIAALCCLMLLTACGGGGDDECAERIHCNIQELSSHESITVKENIYDNDDNSISVIDEEYQSENTIII